MIKIITVTYSPEQWHDSWNKIPSTLFPVDFIDNNHHSPSIRQMMQAMGLRSPAPIQSRLRHLQEKGWIKWQEGQRCLG